MESIGFAISGKEKLLGLSLEFFFDLLNINRLSYRLKVLSLKGGSSASCLGFILTVLSF